MAKITELRQEFGELESAIRLAAREASELKTTSLEAARSLYAATPEVCKPFVDEWIVKELAALIRAERAKLRQPALQAILGFKLPKRMVRIYLPDHIC